jgi:hypothetical protein
MRVHHRIVPDVEGHFTARETFSVGYSFWPATITGAMTDRFVVIEMTPARDGSASSHFSAFRDAKAQLGSGVCLA